MKNIRDELETILIACELKDEPPSYENCFVGALVEPPKVRFYKKQNMLTVRYPTKKRHMIQFNNKCKSKTIVKISLSSYMRRKLEDYDVDYTKYTSYMKYDDALAYYVIVGDTMRFYLLLEDYGRKNRRHQSSRRITGLSSDLPSLRGAIRGSRCPCTGAT